MLAVDRVRITAPPGPGHTIMLLQTCRKVVSSDDRACHWFGEWVLSIILLPSVGLSFHDFLSRVATGVMSAVCTGIGDLLFFTAHQSQLLSRTSQRSFGGLARSTQYPLRVTPQRGHLALLESCQSQGSGCDAQEGSLAHSRGRLLAGAARV